MTPFEDDLKEELKKALLRCEPPDGFTDRLAARIAALPASPKPRANFYWQWAAAAVLALALGGTALERQQDHVRKGEAAKQQVLLAMRITNAKLQQAQVLIQQVEREGKQ